MIDNYGDYPDEMFEEAERREEANRKLRKEKEEWEREQRNRNILQRYNDYYNMECASLPHGTPITPEHQQMIAFQSMIDAFRCEHLNQEYNSIEIADIEYLIEGLDKQAKEFLERVRNQKND